MYMKKVLKYTAVLLQAMILERDRFRQSKSFGIKCFKLLLEDNNG